VRALVKSIGVNASALYIALFLFIYCSKNEEYYLDMIGLECLYHIYKAKVYIVLYTKRIA
jgi:hypothetical protein